MAWTSLKPPAETPEFTCWISGLWPSKKNNWKPGSRNIYCDPRTKAVLDGITLRLRAARINQMGDNCLMHFSVHFEFHLDRKVAVDPDSGVAGFLDCLQEAGVIANDGPRNAVRGSWAVSTCAKGAEGVQVTVRSMEGI